MKKYSGNKTWSEKWKTERYVQNVSLTKYIEKTGKKK